MQHCEKNLGRLIYFTAQQLGKHAEKLLAPYDLTLEQLQLLKHLDCDQGISQREMGELTQKTPANITRILDRMEIKGHILRQRDPQDRRMTLVFLTPKGVPLLEQMQNILEAFSKHCLAGISDQDLETTTRVLRTIEQNLKKP